VNKVLNIFNIIILAIFSYLVVTNASIAQPIEVLCIEDNIGCILVLVAQSMSKVNHRENHRRIII